MKQRIVVQPASTAEGIPSAEQITAWARLALENQSAPRELTIRIVDREEALALNRGFRGQDKPTNVLSFAAGDDEGLAKLLAAQGEPVPLGDIVICAPLVAEEAASQGKPVFDHWAHLVIHGVLHLLGHDHRDKAEASVMESLETDLLSRIAIPDPYRDD